MDLCPQGGVEASNCISKSTPCWVLTLLFSHNMFSFQPVVNNPPFLPFQLRVVNFCLIQSRHAYAKIETQALNISNVIKLSDYCLQVILICEDK